jgi:hypothetical protein
MSSLSLSTSAHHGDALPSPQTAPANGHFTFGQARARFEERFREFQNKARAYFSDCKPEAKDEAIANSLFLTWRYLVALVERGKADDRLLTSVFYFSCRQTRSGRTIRETRSRDLFELAHKGDQVIVRGLDLDAYVNRRTSVPDTVAFKVDTRAWLDSLTEEQRRRALDLAEGRSTQECAQRWNVSEPAVSFTRRALERSYRRFNGA